MTLTTARRLIFQFIVIATLLAAAGTFAIEAAPFTLFNTGVDNAGTPRLDNQSELHYSLIAGPITGTPIVATAAGGPPFPIWFADNTTSAWIGPTTDTNGPPGSYTYRTTFDLTGFNPSTAQINGGWSTDNNGLDIRINGASLGFTTPFNANTLGFFPFAINSGFVAGLNTLDFVLNNGDIEANPTGLRVELAGDAAVVPEPATLLLFGTTAVGFGLARWRRRRRP